MDVLDLLKELLKFKSITPSDDGALNYIAMLCPSFEAHFINKEGVKNLWLTKGSDDGPHLAFVGHVDVVPSGKGWESDPFIPLEKEGFIYARGAQDMKAGLAAFLCASIKHKLDKGRLSILITSDEEGDAKHGTKEILSFMKERSCLPDFAIVGEPSCVQTLGDTIKYARRGSINALLRIFGKQGHVAYPDKCDNPIHKAASILPSLCGYALDAGNDDFEPSRIIITNISSGLGVDNVVPKELQLRFNVRNSNLTSLEDVRSYVMGVCEGLDYDLSLNEGSSFFITDKTHPAIDLLKQIIEKKLGINAQLNAKGGTSDARFVSAFGIDVVEFGVCNDSIHAVNERVLASEVIKLEEIYASFLQGYFKG